MIFNSEILERATASFGVTGTAIGKAASYNKPSGSDTVYDKAA